MYKRQAYSSIIALSGLSVLLSGNSSLPILSELMKEAKHLGLVMFLLDDGWFANKYPRKNDHAGLGDWDVNHDKLPGGIPALVKAAKAEVSVISIPHYRQKSIG